MKAYQNSLMLRLGAVIALLSLCYTPITPMLMKQSPEQKRAIAARIAILHQKIISSVWVQTSDNEMISLTPWKIEQLGELKTLLTAHAGKTSATTPIKATMLT